MIDKNEVIAFFDKYAPSWDAEMIKNDEIINRILDNAEVCRGSRVLDVACGTGVMIPYYLSRNAESVLGIDISPNMARIAADKFKDVSKVKIVCGDVEKMSEEYKDAFDAIVIYNAFPHFSNQEGLIKSLSHILAEGGSLTVAHGMSREAIDAHHRGSAGHVSNGLMPAEKLAEIFGKYLKVTQVISNDKMYQVVGVK